MPPPLTQWLCTIEIAWVDLERPYPGSYKQETLANRGQKVRSRSTDNGRFKSLPISFLEAGDN